MRGLAGRTAIVSGGVTLNRPGVAETLAGYGTKMVIANNPIDDVEPPKVTRKQLVTLSAEPCAQRLDAIKHTVHWPVLITIAPGMPRGEVLALRCCRPNLTWRSDLR